MTLVLTTNQVWQAVENESFAVVGMVTAKNEARTVGILFVVRDRKLYFGSYIEMWKVRHISANPNVSLTVIIDRGIVCCLGSRSRTPPSRSAVWHASWNLTKFRLTCCKPSSVTKL